MARKLSGMDEHDVINLLGFPDEIVRGPSTMTSQIWRCDWCDGHYDFENR